MPSFYSDDVLASRRAGRAQQPAQVPAQPGLRVQHAVTGFTGQVVATEQAAVILRDRSGCERLFPLRQGAFRIDGRVVTLIKPPGASNGPALRRTASGSIVSPRTAAQVAKASRIYVEGTHDAELLEKVWGDDLRDAGIVVEPLGGADHLGEAVRTFAPGPGRRLGVLVDHLVAGSKEQRIAAAVTHPHVLITGHPYVDVWAGVRPRTLGLTGWPDVPRGQPWKDGVCAALGVGEPAAFWRRLLKSVNTYADLEQPLIGAVERLLDFVTDPPETVD